MYRIPRKSQEGNEVMVGSQTKPNQSCGRVEDVQSSVKDKPFTLKTSFAKKRKDTDNYKQILPRSVHRVIKHFFR